MKRFKEYLFGKYRNNNKDFKFNTHGLGYLNSTFFYLGSDGIYSYKTFKRIDRSDERRLITYLYDNRQVLLKRYDNQIESEVLTPTKIRVNTFIYNERSHAEAIRRYVQDTKDRPLF